MLFFIYFIIYLLFIILIIYLFLFYFYYFYFYFIFIIYILFLFLFLFLLFLFYFYYFIFIIFILFLFIFLFLFLLFLEFCNGGDLLQKIKNKEILQQKKLLEICKQILSALDFMHKHELVHLDVKPENIYISRTVKNEEIYKLGDFGFAMSSKLKDKKDLDELYGDDHYASPEIRNSNWKNLIGKLEKSDVFSLGASIFALSLCSTENIQENIRKLQSHDFVSFSSLYSLDFYLLLSNMLHPLVDSRFSVPQLLVDPLLQCELQRKFLKAKKKISLLKDQIQFLSRDRSLLFNKIDLVLNQQTQLSNKFVDCFSNFKRND